jgi:hypothetical protein
MPGAPCPGSPRTGGYPLGDPWGGDLDFETWDPTIAVCPTLPPTAHTSSRREEMKIAPNGILGPRPNSFFASRRDAPNPFLPA